MTFKYSHWPCPCTWGRCPGRPRCPWSWRRRCLAQDGGSRQSRRPSSRRNPHLMITSKYRKSFNSLKSKLLLWPISCHFISALYYSAHTLRCPKICQERFRQGLKRIQTYISTNVLLCICKQDFIWLWLKVARHLFGCMVLALKYL